MNHKEVRRLRYIGNTSGIIRSKIKEEEDIMYQRVTYEEKS